VVETVRTYDEMVAQIQGDLFNVNTEPTIDRLAFDWKDRENPR
jgi:hypothetical protein